jgi:hypothetical protein
VGTRLEFQQALEGLKTGLNVYFQPPPGFQMTYPAIVYNRDFRSNLFADNKPYRGTTRYQVTVIDADPDSEIPDLVASMPMNTFVRHYTTEGLNHDVYYVYF